MINNARFGLFGLFEATPIDKVREQFGVNVFGVMNVIREVLPHFRPDIEPLVKARRETCEDDYLANMRSQFSVNA